MTSKTFSACGLIASVILGFAACSKNVPPAQSPKLPPLLTAEDEAVVCDDFMKPGTHELESWDELAPKYKMDKPKYAAWGRWEICNIRYPKKFSCDLPTVPWESFHLRLVSRRNNRPGHSPLYYTPRMWSAEERARRPQLSEDDKPIGKLQEGSSLWLVYRVKKTGELVICSRWLICDDTDKGLSDCDPKCFEPKEFCTYSGTVLIGH